MDAERWRQISALLGAALALPKGERARFLDGACKGDASLRQELDSLMAQRTEASRFLEVPALDDEPTRTVSTGIAVPNDRSIAVVVPGQMFGPYYVVRRLGRGGMGEVFEAEQVETGRRLALKILSRPLTGDRHRARFLREGRLAASITHEHCIYVYGTEEIHGCPVITMELATGGSLKDRVELQGPLASAQAVDAILQVISGLETAAAAGVLHRDVKPSNCFVSSDGSIKIGDFGLSISTETGDETHLTTTGTILATPAFAPPEQLRGGSMDFRADLYSVGATLYYLLTGTPPFAGSGVVELVAKVLNESPTAPGRVRPGVPHGLENVVLRCLAKQPADRPDSYQQLRRELMPFSSQAPSPAALGPRFLAGLLDSIIISTLASFFLQLKMSTSPPGSRAAVVAAWWILYFGVPEGIWGASPGKQLLGIRVVRTDHQAPGIWWAAVRVAAFLFALIVPAIPLAMFGLFPSTAILEALPDVGPPSRPAVGPTSRRAVITEHEVRSSAVQVVGFALLFAIARRRNGFAALHDLMSGTRVVRHAEPYARESMPIPSVPVEVPTHARRVGPYLALDPFGTADAVVNGYDDLLRRRTWIHILPVGTPAVSPERRDIARPGRLRWLNGRRTPEECWDAYEAPDGLPFLSIARSPTSWSAVRFWLLDLASEFDASVTEKNDCSATKPEHIWITRSGRAVVLDIPAPRGSMSGTTGSNPTSLRGRGNQQAFLLGFALAALGASWDSHGKVVASSRSDWLPLHARAFLSDLGKGRFRDSAGVVSALREILSERAVLTRRRRMAHLALTATFPAVAVLAALASSAVLGRFTVAGVVAPLAGSLAVLANLAIWSAALFRGGLMFQVLRVAVVGPDGAEAPRPRALTRAFLAWSPVIVFLLALAFDLVVVAVLALVILAAGLIVAAWVPARGLQDHVANTRLVPR